MEPISIAAGTLGASFLTEGIKFLWDQAGKIINRYLEKKKFEKEKKTVNNQKLARIEDEPPKFMEISPVRIIDFARVENKLEELKELRKELFTYVSGDTEITPENKEMLAYADQLQQILSEIFAEDVNIPQIKVRQFIESIKEGAEMTGLKADTIENASIDVEQQSKDLEGKVIGVEAKEIK